GHHRQGHEPESLIERKSLSEGLPRSKPSRTYPRSSRSIRHSPTLLGFPCHQAPQRRVRLRRMIERLQEPLAFPIRKDDRGFLRETNLVPWDHARFADAQLVLVHLLDDDCRIGERFGQADAALRIGRPRFQAHLRPFLSSAIYPSMHMQGITVKWESP